MDDDLDGISGVAKDPDLREWLKAERGEARELIVEARFPRSKASVMHDSRGRLSPILKGPGPSAKRDEALAELSAFASSLLPEPPKTLRAAGALVLRATPAQARELAAHPLVKAIRPNRRLRP